VLFPDGEILFGDVGAGATTPYRPVPHGVYAYAAYRYEVDGEDVTQPVIDWVGEVPLEGSAFTYAIAAEPSQPGMLYVQLLQVIRDE
jgi:hypothetical protein